jgi:hypothetical protein
MSLELQKMFSDMLETSVNMLDIMLDEREMSINA